MKPPIPTDRNLAGLHPSSAPYSWLASRQVGNAVAIAAGRYARGRLIDIGCGEKPYAAAFAAHVVEHVGVDHPDSPHSSKNVDVLAIADQIPLADETFDTVLMSEVLEHLEDPQSALREAHRLLTPGGHLILTTPFIWMLHEEPRDFFRYTPHGLRWVLSQAGFDVVEITPIGGQWSTIALLLASAFGRTPLRPLRSPLQRLAVYLDRLQFRPWMAWNHLAVGVKGQSG